MSIAQPLSFPAPLTNAEEIGAKSLPLGHPRLLLLATLSSPFSELSRALSPFNTVSGSAVIKLGTDWFWCLVSVTSSLLPSG